MILTNKMGLPESVVNVIRRQIYKPREDRVRVSELIHNPLIKRLTLDHWDEITADASEFFNVLLGTSVHYILEQMAGANVLTEFTMQMDIPGTDKHLKGTLDRCVVTKRRMEDHKVVSVWSLIFGAEDGYEDYQAQQNLYRWMLKNLTGMDMKELRLNAYLKDWSQRDAERDKKYPEIPFQFINLPVWTDDQTKGYVNDRLKVHFSDPVECTPHEKWQKQTTFAIKAPNAAKAKMAKSHITNDYIKSKAEAVEVIKSKGWLQDLETGKLIIETRVGECVKCERYCLVRDICPYSDKSKVKHIEAKQDNVVDVSDKVQKVNETPIVEQPVIPQPETEVVDNPPPAKTVESKVVEPEKKEEPKSKTERKEKKRRGRPPGSKNKKKADKK